MQPGVLNYCLSYEAPAGLSIITGLHGLLEWTTGLTFFALKIILMAYNKISFQYMHYIGF